MADYYTQFSEVIPRLTADEEAWLTDQLGYTNEDEDVIKFLDDYDDASLKDWIGFSHEFDVDTDWGRYLWVYDDGGGEIDHLAYLMQKFLAKWRPDDYLTINWACTCSKPRVGEFGGGATFVTATEIEYINSGTWLYEKMLAFDGVKKEKKALQAEVKCERCSKVITGDEASPAPNPCEADLHDDYTNVIMCDDCRNEVSDDI